MDNVVTNIRRLIDAQVSGSPHASATRSPGAVADDTLQLPSRMAALAALDENILAASERIGQCPPTPPTLRGRMGLIIVQVLHRMMWWYGHYVKEAFAAVYRRNREQQEQMLAIVELLLEIRGMRRQVIESVTMTRVLRQEADERIRQLESNHVKLQSSQSELATSHDVCALAKQMQELKDKFQVSMATIDRHLGTAHTYEDVQSEIKRLYADLHALQERFADLGHRVHQQRAELSIQDSRISFLIAGSHKGVSKDTIEQPPADSLTHVDSTSEAMYVAFQNVFRGSEAEIKERQKTYMPLIQRVNAGTQQRPIIDLGSGRGEWLDVLRENGLEARGIDTNTVMLEFCRSKGLRVEQGDALSYLRGVPDNSVGAITSFHLIEHLPFKDILTLLDEALRVLQPGGCLILETPNPHNVLVGASTFYLDPTHVKPIPSPTLRFFVEARGFTNVEVMNLHPYPESVRLPESSGVAQRLNDYFYGPQDYSVLGYRP